MTCTELQARLDALLAGRDKLVLGGPIVRVRMGEKEVQYAAGDHMRVDQLIREIRLQMARLGCNGCGRLGVIRFTPSDG